MKKKNPYMIKILEVADKIIMYLLKTDMEPQSPSEIARNLGLTQSRVFRVLKSLEELEYVYSYKGRFVLGVKFSDVALKMKRVEDSFYVKSILLDLTQLTGDTAHLFLPLKDKAVCTAQFSGDNSLQVAKVIGERIPMNVAAAPLVLLAYLTEKEQESIIENLEMVAFTENTITDREELRNRLKQIRSQGYAIDNEEYEIGACSVSAPIFDKGYVGAALSIDIPHARFGEDRREQTIKLVVNAAQKISESLA
jgi:DNA-binding IclR family transcriptional regulator